MSLESDILARLAVLCATDPVLAAQIAPGEIAADHVLSGVVRFDDDLFGRVRERGPYLLIAPGLWTSADAREYTIPFSVLLYVLTHVNSDYAQMHDLISSLRGTLAPGAWGTVPPPVEFSADEPETPEGAENRDVLVSRLALTWRLPW